MMIFPSSLGMRAVTMAMLALLCEMRAQGIFNNVGPSFTKEPPGLVEFINTMGTHIDCAASGLPIPSVTWISVDGSLLANISDIRNILTNGTLILYPFRSEQYRPDIHAAMYHCLVKNVLGSITSIDVQIRAVLQKSYEVQVYDTYAMEGNTAVIKCHVPTVVKDYVEVVAWIKNDNLLIQSKEIEGSMDKYTIMSTGALHIQNVNSGDAGTKYKCKTFHRLTGETQVSSSTGQLFVTESRGKAVPRIVDSAATVSVKQGNVAVLSCVAQGNPTPDLKWYVKTEFGQLREVPENTRYIQTRSSLIIREAQLSDEALYSCTASSELGNDHLDITLTVTNRISVWISPKVNLVKFGDMAVFSCEITGQPAASFTWLHNASPIAQKTEKLTIHNVQMSDQGMYQCIVKNTNGAYHASSELRFSEIVPQWAEKFKEVVVYPGNPVSMQCIAIGVPLPKISWNIDNQPIKNNSQLLITYTTDEEGRAISRLAINSAVVEDGGLYSCTAYNNGGEIHYAARINVYGRIHVKNIPALVAISGNDVSLNCPIYGYPWISIKWEKSGNRLPSELRHIMMDNGSLMIENVHRSVDSGSYTCIVESKEYEQVKGVLNLQVMGIENIFQKITF